MAGQRGPKALPANVHLMRGNASKKPIGELVDGVQPEVAIPTWPPHLLAVARKEWKRIGPLLHELGLVAQIDRTALALYCQAYAWWVWHEVAFKRDVDRIAAKHAAFDAGERERALQAISKGGTYEPREWKGGDGMMIETPNGGLTYNPHWVGKKQAASEVDKYLQSFGLSPSARARVTPSDNYPFLPGMEPAQASTQNSAPAPVVPAKFGSLSDFAPKDA